MASEGTVAAEIKRIDAGIQEEKQDAKESAQNSGEGASNVEQQSLQRVEEALGAGNENKFGVEIPGYTPEQMEKISSHYQKLRTLLPPQYPKSAFNDCENLLDEIENSDYSLEGALEFHRAMNSALNGIKKDIKNFKKDNPSFKTNEADKAYIQQKIARSRTILKAKKNLSQYLGILNVMFHNWDADTRQYRAGAKFTTLKKFWKEAQKERQVILAPVQLAQETESEAAAEPAAAPKTGKSKKGKQGRGKGLQGEGKAAEFHTSQHGLFALIARQAIRAREGDSDQNSFLATEMQPTPVSTKQAWMSRLGM